MKRLLLTVSLWLMLTGSAWPFAASLNIRGSLEFVNDGAGQTYVNGDTYPTTRNGVTFGWTAMTSGTTGNFCNNAGAGTNRNSSVDPRFAGITYAAPGECAAFVVDVPSAGSYDIRVAFGDSAGDDSGQTEYLEIFNGFNSIAQTTGPSLGILLNGVTGPTTNQYLDATAIIRTSPSNWISSNVAVTKTISVDADGKTRVVFQYGKIALSSYSVVAHVEVSDAAPPPSGATIKHRVTQ